MRNKERLRSRSLFVYLLQVFLFSLLFVCFSSFYIEDEEDSGLIDVFRVEEVFPEKEGIDIHSLGLL